MIKKVFAVSIIAATVALAGCSSDDDDDGGDNGGMTPGDMMPDLGNGNNLADALAADTGDADGGSRFDTLLSAVTAADLGTTLGNVNNTFTVFAPTDAAFAALPEGALDALLANSAELNNTILYHVAARPEGFELAAGPLTAVAGGDLTIAAVEATEGEEMPAEGEEMPAEGEEMPAEGEEMAADGGFSVNGNVLGTAIDAENGVIYPIDMVLTPVTPAPDMGGDGMDGGDMPPAGDIGEVETAFSQDGDVSEAFTAFTASFGRALDDTANTWTLFAPSNDALTAASLTSADVTTAVLQSHIVVTGSLDEAALGALTEVMSNSGVVHAVGTNAGGGLTVGGFDVTLVTSGQSTVYQIEGILPLPQP